jgi:hypothetical protein
VSWRVGDARTITFTHDMGAGHVANIDVSRDGGATWAPLGSLTTTAATSGSYPWTVTGPATSSGRVRVTWAGDPAATDMSNRNFTILPRVTVTAPNTAVTWTAGSLRTVAWAHNLGLGARVDIDFSPDAGATWIALARGVASNKATTGSASVTMPAMATAQALIKVTQSDDPSQSDVSNVPFTLTP